MDTLFDALEWKPHPSGFGGEQAIMRFPNGYEASVLRGGIFYTIGGSYEIAVRITGVGLCYDTPITDDVLGYLSRDQAEDALRAIRDLPHRQN
jgi:hypothetical protein